MRFDFLSDDWFKEQAKAGKLPLATVQTPNGLVISAATEELRKFALEPRRGYGGFLGALFVESHEISQPCENA